MAVTAHTYTKLGLSLGTAKINFLADTLKVMLLSAYTVGTTQDTAQFVADVKAVATETVGTGYTAGGQTLASVTYAESGHVYTLDCADPAWTITSAFSAAYAVIYDSTPGSDATNPVINYHDFGGTTSFTSGTFTFTVNASGLLTATGS